MRQLNRSRERLVWAAAVMALATSACWLAAICVTLLAKQSGVMPPQLLTAGRALVRVAWLLFREAVPVALIAVLVCGVIGLAWAQRHEETARRGARHA